MSFPSLVRCVLAPALLAAATVQAAPVAPPPLPPGAAQTVIEPGLDPGERHRSVRAHHHKGHVKKDFTRDDSTPEPRGNGNGVGNANGNGNGVGGNPPKGGK
jgi:hypothetical protein